MRPARGPSDAVPEAPLVSIRGLRKEYRALRPLRIQQLTIAAGDIVSLAGLDADAAEMLVSLVTGAALPDEGEIELFGRSTAAIPDPDAWLALLEGVGLVTPRAVLMDAYSVRQNLALPFTVSIDPLAARWLPTVDALAREVGVPEPQWDTPAGAIDADARVRVRLGRALALDPVLLLAEHPTAGLSLARAAAFGTLLRRIAAARRMAVLAVTSDAVFARALGGRRLHHAPATGACTPAGFWRTILGR